MAENAEKKIPKNPIREHQLNTHGVHWGRGTYTRPCPLILSHHETPFQVPKMEESSP